MENKKINIGEWQGGSSYAGGFKPSLKEIIEYSKLNPSETYLVTDDNYSNIGVYWLKNGKFAKHETFNAAYDFSKNKTSLKEKKDVIYKFKKMPEEFAGGGSIKNKKIEEIKTRIKELHEQLKISTTDEEKQHFRQLIKFRENELLDLKENQFAGGGSIESDKAKEIKEKIADLEKRSQNKNLPESAVKKLKEMINALKSDLAKEEKQAPVKVDKKEKISNVFKKAQEKANEQKTEVKIEIPSAPKEIEIDTTKKVQSVSPNFNLIKISNTVFVLRGKKDAVDRFELNKKADGWYAFCLNKKEKSFESLNSAVNHIIKEVYKSEVAEFVEEKKAKARKDLERRKAREKQGKPELLTANEVVDKSINKAIDKIEQKAEKGESVKRDVNSVLKHFKEGVKELRQYRSEINPDEIRSLIKELEKLL